MKILCLLFIVALVTLSLGQPQSITDTNERCMMNCDLVELKPICCTDERGETRTFNNLCILKTENCLRNRSFLKTADGPCP